MLMIRLVFCVVYLIVLGFYLVVYIMRDVIKNMLEIILVVFIGIVKIVLSFLVVNWIY